MRYIFEYVGGTKGDMTVRFLNGVEPAIRFDRHNITDPQDLGCENWLKLVSQKDMTLERFEEVLSVNPYEYVPAHPLWCCCPTTIQGTENVLYSKYIDLLKKYDYEIISLKFEPKHYVTIFIERVLKNNYKLDLPLGSMVPSDPADRPSRFRHRSIIGDEGILSSNGVRGTNQSFMKQLALDEAFEGGPTEIYKRFNSTPARSKFNEMTNDRTLFHYDDLYLSDSCPFPDHSHREDEWLMLVEQSWCDYDENDYRKFEVPEGCE
jgi:hypothetical protein